MAIDCVQMLLKSLWPYNSPEQMLGIFPGSVVLKTVFEIDVELMVLLSPFLIVYLKALEKISGIINL